jgi:hypothetical protein
MKQVSQNRLAQITGATTASGQCAVLRQLGVMPLIRPDGSLCIFEEALLSAMIVPRQDERDQPRWEVFDGQAAKKRRA